MTTLSNVMNSLQSAVASGGTTVSNASEAELGRNQFLTLLVAQMQYQDPLNPMESQDFTAQLAQFSSLEQLYGVNDALANIEGSLSSQENENALDYIGKVVKTLDNTLTVAGDTVDSASYYIAEPGDITITVYDTNGLEVCEIDAGWQAAGEHGVDWDGCDQNGTPVADGLYAFGISAVNSAGEEMSGESYHSGEVSGVTYADGEAYLMVGERLVSPERVIEIKQSTEQ